MRSLKIQVLIHRFTTFEHIIQEIYISFYLQLLDHYRITTIQRNVLLDQTTTENCAEWREYFNFVQLVDLCTHRCMPAVGHTLAGRPGT